MVSAFFNQKLSIITLWSRIWCIKSFALFQYSKLQFYMKNMPSVLQSFLNKIISYLINWRIYFCLYDGLISAFSLHFHNFVEKIKMLKLNDHLVVCSKRNNQLSWQFTLSKENANRKLFSILPSVWLTQKIKWQENS